MAGETETVTVIRSTQLDVFGDPTPGDTVEFDVDGCLFAPGPSQEVGIGTQQVDTDATIYGPVDMDVRSTDRIRARGQLFTVVGDPQQWSGAGTVVVLRKFA